MPDTVGVDSMHLLGLVKQIIQLLFDSNKAKQRNDGVYLGNIIIIMNLTNKSLKSSLYAAI